jgi:RNA polymerase primary sigma factor
MSESIGQSIPLAVSVSGESHDQIDHLVRSSLSFVFLMAREFRDLGVPFEDLVAEGNVGLVEAARRYDPDRGTRFITYARWWVRKSMLKALESQARVVRLPGYHYQKVKEFRAAESTLTETLGRKPSLDEIAERLPGRSSRAARSGTLSHRELSLDERINEDRKETFAECVPERGLRDAEAGLIREQSLRMILDAMEDLSEQQQRILSQRFGLSGEEELSLKAIGDRLELSHERVRQIESEALGRLRHAIRPRHTQPRRRRSS